MLPAPHRTHEVLNQPPALERYNLFSTHLPLVEALKREHAGWAEERALELGRILGDEALLWGQQANENPPVLSTHDRFGNRLDEVSFHPAWHELLRLAMSFGLHGLPWREARPGAHVARAAMFMMLTQVEAGVGCPLSMTYSGIPTLRLAPELAAEWEPRLTSFTYDKRFIPSSRKQGALCGMALTEKQGGSDVRASTTRAAPIAGAGTGSEYAITGHKWFCSAPMCDVFFVLAQAPGGLTCFLVPRFLPDGSKNRMFLQRLKNKLGNRSNASSEVEFDGTWAQRIGEEGRGVPAIIEMIAHTRLDCVLGSTALMRAATVQAIHHATHRSTFGRKLVDQPLMMNVLADLSLESEAATVLAMRLARAYDASAENETERQLRRLATAVGKYWVCKRTPGHVAEALECLGGNGYIEDSGLPRLYREAPLNSIWEGSGNVICLDLLRTAAKNPESFAALFAELDRAQGGNKDLDAFVTRLKVDMSQPENIEVRARDLAERIALALQGTLLVQHAPPYVSDAFVSSRLSRDSGRVYGTLPAKTDFKSIIRRNSPTQE